MDEGSERVSRRVCGWRNWIGERPLGDGGAPRGAKPSPHLPRALRWAQRRRVSRGQALVEFALVAPIFFLLIFGVIEFSLINTSIGAYNFAAKDAARIGSIAGPTNAAIDQEIVALVNSHVSAVPAARTIEIDIFQATSAGAPTGLEDSYTAAGVAIGSPTWPYTLRNDGAPANATQSPFLGVRIIYQYTYVTAILSSAGPTLILTTTAVFRIEPQEQSAEVAPTLLAQRAASHELRIVAAAEGTQPPHRLCASALPQQEAER